MWPQEWCVGFYQQLLQRDVRNHRSQFLATTDITHPAGDSNEISSIQVTMEIQARPRETVYDDSVELLVKIMELIVDFTFAVAIMDEYRFPQLTCQTQLLRKNVALSIRRR